jgi:solute carrier family 8 (sodium/calcium exchanger)
MKDNECPDGSVVQKDVLKFDKCKDCAEFTKGLQVHLIGVAGSKNTENCNDNPATWKGGMGKDADGEEKNFSSVIKRTAANQNIPDYVAGDCKNGNMGGKCGPVHIIPFAQGNMILEYSSEVDPELMCEGGMFLPFIPGEFMWGKGAHIVIYFLLMIFSFLGIAIIADVFMAAIEVITSKERTVEITNPDGTKQKMTYLVWNATVANLTLMALGSSAPEILLSVIETIGTLEKTADPGGLGPGTIVGSAAFNLLVIIAICVMAINGKKEDGLPDFRKIDEMGVFTVTAIYSVFAYVWLFLCVKDNTVQLWEAIVTFMLFPLLVFHCYLADKKLIPAFLGGGKKKSGAQHIVGTDGMGAKSYGANGDLDSQLGNLEAVKMATNLLTTDALQENDALGQFKVSTGTGLSANEAAVEAATQEIARLAVQEHLANKKQSIAQSKINARRQMTGRQRVTLTPKENSPALQGMMKKASQTADTRRTSINAILNPDIPEKTFVSFSCPSLSVLENAGNVTLTVQCNRAVQDSNADIYIVAQTQDGTAISEEDYVHTREELHFAPGETEKAVVVSLIDDTEYEPDENFLVTLEPAKSGRKGVKSGCEFDFFPFKIASVTIVNDDDPGTFEWESPAKSTEEKGDDKSGFAKLKIVRRNGADGEVTVKYKSADGSAIAGDDFEPLNGEVVFKHQESEKVVKVRILEDDNYEKSETFSVDLSVDQAGAKLGANSSVVVTILGDEDSARVANQVAALMKLQLEKLSVSTGSWAEQFDEAMSISGEEGESPSTMDCVMHICTFGWKVLFAIVPPTCYKDGWVTFFVALTFVGLLTAFVADIAGIFGCLLGLQDSITAITFVALGTSLPDTFASKTAAVNDEYADASVGNVTGSNSVNVFLGLGLPWLLATIVHTMSDFQSDSVLSKGKIVSFEAGGYPMIAGSLGFSVVLFCICAVVCIATLYLRRFVFGYELGGSSVPRTLTGLFFIGLWVVYVVVSSLEVEGHIVSFL